MLTLDLPAEPYWLDLPRGVRVEIRPVTTAVMAAAQAAAARRLAAIRIADPNLDPDMSRGLIDAENPRKPLSDAKLAELLKQSGIPVARRTVAKYREGMNILASHERVRIG